MEDRFNADPRRKQELSGRPIADKIYRSVFGEDIIITKFDHDAIILDVKYAIDIQLQLVNGQILLGQEKFLSYQQSKYASVTVEYEQNQFTGEYGDWYKLAVQFYFVGYFTENKSSFMPWIILDWARVVCMTNDNKLAWRFNKNKDGHALASFTYLPMNEFPELCVIAKRVSQNA